MDRSVFHIAHGMIERSPERSLPAVTLQKLCFFSYTWYVHLTGFPLYLEQTWAMQKGPVVGDLLSAHSGLSDVTVDTLEPQFDQWALRSVAKEKDSYIEAVLDGVYEAYSGFTPWELAEISHAEPTWEKAWELRGSSQRSPMPREDLLTHYSAFTPVLTGVTPEGKEFDIKIELPDPVTTFVRSDLLEQAISAPVRPHPSFVEKIRQLGAA